MIKLSLIPLLIISAPVSAGTVATEKYPVSPMAWETNVKRFGHVIARYVRFSPDYPCLRLETFEPIHLKRIDRKEICKFQTDRGVVDVRQESLTGVIHENVKLEDNTFSFSTEIIFAEHGYYYSNCKIAISENGKLSEPTCKKGERPSEPAGKE